MPSLPHLLTISMSILLLISSLSLVISFSTINVQRRPILSKSEGLALQSVNRIDGKITKQRISTQLYSNADDKIGEKKFYGFRSIAGQGVPSAALADPLSTSPTDIIQATNANPASFTPTLTIPSNPVSKNGFSDIPSIASTSSPSFDSTLTFNTDKPKSQAIFTMLNRLKRLNYKIGLIRKLKITTWDSPR